MKIHTDDQVIVISGKDKGKKAKVLRSFPEEKKVLVEGVGIVTRHMKRQGTTPGQKVSFEKPIDVSNVMLLDPKTGEPTRVGYKMENGKKVGRVAKKSGTLL
ncbi:MAG: 50S ribosomal protein L24 [Candidatus Gracilibacteria bacterium]|jgi:large subunit ribosomal protein L24|nr:50S ribosomal protein L24 [Candidatus Gracilibacteria bacterium]